MHLLGVVRVLLLLLPFIRLQTDILLLLLIDSAFFLLSRVLKVVMILNNRTASDILRNEVAEFIQHSPHIF